MNKKIIYSMFLIFSTLLTAEPLVLPDSFYKLSGELQKEILLDEEKLQSYLSKFGIKKNKEVKKEVKIAKKSDFITAPELKRSQLIKNNFLLERYIDNLSFNIKDSKGDISTVRIGSGNGYKVSDKNIKVDIEGAIAKFPGGIFNVSEISTTIEEGVAKVIQIEVENALELKYLKTEFKISYLVISYIDGELYLDLAANEDTLKIKIDKDYISIKNDPNLKTERGNAFDLTKAKIKIKER